MYIYIECDQFERGAGYWKFNNSLLNDERFINETKSVIDKQKMMLVSCDPDEQWECLKSAIIQHCKKLTRKTCGRTCPDNKSVNGAHNIEGRKYRQSGS